MVALNKAKTAAYKASEQLSAIKRRINAAEKDKEVTDAEKKVMYAEFKAVEARSKEANRKLKSANSQVNKSSQVFSMTSIRRLIKEIGTMIIEDAALSNAAWDNSMREGDKFPRAAIASKNHEVHTLVSTGGMGHSANHIFRIATGVDQIIADKLQHIMVNFLFCALWPIFRLGRDIRQSKSRQMRLTVQMMVSAVEVKELSVGCTELCCVGKRNGRDRGHDWNDDDVHAGGHGEGKQTQKTGKSDQQIAIKMNIS